MGLYDDVVEVPRRTMVLFFVVDCSGSMAGNKIGTVNTAIEEVIPELKDISESNADAQIKVATLQFSTGARWNETAPVPAEVFRWNYLDANGLTDLGEACIQLNEKLKRIDSTGGIKKQNLLAKEKADYFRNKIKNLPLKMFTDEKCSSNCVTTLCPVN